MNFAWLVALRYLRSPYKPPILRLITLLSVLGVAAGVATLVIALAVNSGFRQTLQDRLLGVTAHVTLSRSGAEGIRDYSALAERLRRSPGVRSASPAIYETVLLSAAGRARGVVLKGVDPAIESTSSDALRHIIAGAADFSPDEHGSEAVLLGKILAEELRLSPGDYITVTSPQGRLTPFGMIPRTRRFRLTGIFDSGFYDTDANWGFVTLPSAQALAGISDVAGMIEIRLERPDNAERIAPTLLTSAGAGYSARTWMQENQALFRALRLEKLVTAIFIGLIVFVAGLNLLVLLAMTVAEKSRDIAVLIALGARRYQLRRVFLLQGLCIGTLGTLLGLALGYSLSWAANAGQWIRLDPQVYAVSYVPFDTSPLDGLWITLAALVISAAATLYPARAASRILPVEILRFE